MRERLSTKCFLNSASNDVIKLLSRSFFSNRAEEELYSKWLLYTLKLHNKNIEFLSLAGIKQQNGEHEYNIVNKDFKDNYMELKDYEELEVLQSDILTNEDAQKVMLKRDMLIFTMIVINYQYLQAFQDRSIKNNLWNYCLTSTTISYNSMIIGACTILCQYMYVGILLFNMISNFSLDSDTEVVIVTIISTVITLIYCYGTLTSFLQCRDLYRFLLKIYSENPEFYSKKSVVENNTFKNEVNMTTCFIKYNYCCDVLSNCILPIILPIINFFIILNSEDCIDAILNSVAVFFIIQIDEDLYMQTDYERDNQHLEFSRWFISTLYSKFFPEKQKIFYHEKQPIQEKTKSLTFTKSKNRISPSDPVQGSFLPPLSRTSPFLASSHQHL